MNVWRTHLGFLFVPSKVSADRTRLDQIDIVFLFLREGANELTQREKKAQTHEKQKP